MKYLILFILLPFLASSQTINTQIDEFTGVKTIKTNWGVLRSDLTSMDYFRIRNVDDIYLFEVKKAVESDYMINSNQELMLLMENGEVIKMGVVETILPCIGCGARGLAGSALWGVHAIYVCTKEQIETLSKTKISKFRINFSKGYLNETINKKRQKQVIDTANKFLEALE